MQKPRLIDGLNLKLLPTQRELIEAKAEREEVSFGEAARRLLNAGIEAEGLED